MRAAAIATSAGDMVWCCIAVADPGGSAVMDEGGRTAPWPWRSSERPWSPRDMLAGGRRVADDAMAAMSICRIAELYEECAALLVRSAVAVAGFAVARARGRAAAQSWGGPMCVAVVRVTK